MKRWIDLGARVLLGLIFFVFGLNGFLHFLPMPELAGPARSMMEALAGTGYFFPVLKLVETISGAALLADLFVPLALVLLAPVVVQIALFHLFLDPAGLPLAAVIVVLEAYLGFGVYRERFAGVLRPR
ncbi:MAG: DoxX family protein [Acidobacteria bacterium]|nr:MAG: DoxX family protein [Acidobacteriota bacterium]